MPLSNFPRDSSDMCKTASGCFSRSQRLADGCTLESEARDILMGLDVVSGWALSFFLEQLLLRVK